MSRNSSVAVLADCTDLYNSHVSLIGLNGPPSVLSIENESILSNNTDISPSQVVSSVSFQERVRSTDLAALFPRGSLNKKISKIKKKKKSSEISLSASQSSENISFLQSNTNVTLSDENVSASFEECSENKDELSKPFNKRSYLKKKSVNISFDSGSLNNSISEKSLKRKSRAINISLDKLNSKGRGDIETIKNDSLEFEEKSAKVLKKRPYLKKKSVNFSFDSGSLNNSVAEKSSEDSRINNVSLQSKRKSALRSRKIDSVLNIDNLNSGESSEEKSKPKKTKSNPKRTNISCIGLTSAEGNSLDENTSIHDKTIDSSNAIDEDSAKVLNKNLYLKKKSINISFDSSSVNDSNIEKSEVADVSLDQLSSKIINVTEPAELASDPLEGSKKMEIKKSPAKVFNKNSYLKKKSIKLSFDSSSLNASTVEKTLERESEVANVSFDPLASETENAAESAKKNSTDSNVQNSNINGTNDYSNNENLHGINILMNGNSSLVENIEEINNLATENEKVTNLLIIENLKAAVDPEDDTVNEINISKSSEVCLAACAQEVEMKSAIESNMQTNISTDSLKAIDSESAQIFNKNLYLKKKSINILFDSSSVNDSNIEKSEVAHVSLNSISSKIAKVTESAKRFSKESEISQNSDGTHDHPHNESINAHNVKNGNSPVVENNEEKINSATENDKVLNLFIIKNSKAAIDPEDDTVNEINISKSSEVCLVASAQEETIKSVVDSNMQTNISTGDSLKAIDSESAQIFNKNLYLKKKSINISFDSSSLNASMVEKTLEGNGSVADVSLKSISSKIANVTESAECAFASFDGSKKIENEESTNLFKKNLYLKKKSINISFESSSVIDPISEEKNIQFTDASIDPTSSETMNDTKSAESGSASFEESNASIDPTSSKTMNDTKSAENGSASFEESKEIKTGEESAKLFKKNLYLKKKSINLSFDSSTLCDHDPMTERSLKENNEVGDGASDILSSKITNVPESADNVSASIEESKTMETEEKSAKFFNKNLYLKKKSINVSFDLSSINEPFSQNAEEGNTEVREISLDPLSTKTTNVTEIAEGTSDTLEGSQKIETEKESLKLFNKNLYLKKRSINIPFDSTSLNEDISRKEEDSNLEVGKVSLDSLSSKITNVTETVESIRETLEGSQKIETEEESHKLFNKNLYLKKKSINIPFNSCFLNEDISLNAEGRNSEVSQVSSDPLSSKITNVTETVEGICETLEGSQKIEIEEESHKLFNKNLYLKKKSINIPFNSCFLNEDISQNAEGRNSELDKVPSNPLSSKITNITEPEKIVYGSLEGTQKMESEKEPTEVFNKNLNLKKKNINNLCDSSSITEPISEKGETQVGKISLDQLPSKISNVTETAKDISYTLEGSQDIETEEEPAEICNKKKSTNISFDQCSIKEPICQKAQEGNSEVAEVSLDALSSNIKNVFLSPEVVSAYLEGTSEKENTRVCGVSRSQEVKTQEKSAEICNKKKSNNITLDSSSVKEPICQNAQEGNTEVAEISLDPSSSDIKNVILSPEVVSGPREIKDQEESAEIYNKKNSNNITLDSSYVKEPISQNAQERNTEVAEISLDPSPSNIKNVIVSPEVVSGPQEIKDQEESAEICNKKKSINIALDSSSVKEPISQNAQERNTEVAEISLDSSSSNTKNVIVSPEVVSGPREIKDQEESAEIYNEKKSNNITLDSSCVKEPISQNAQERNTEVAEISLDPSLSNIKNVIVSPEVVSGPQEIKDQEESAEICNKKKSINIALDSSSVKEPISQNALEENTEVAEISLDPSSSNIKNVIVSPEFVSANLEGISEKEITRVCGVSGSQEVKTQEESAEICNKKKSNNITSDSGSVKEQISQNAQEGNTEVAEISLDPSSSNIMNDIVSPEVVSGPQEIKDQEKCAEICNEKKSPNISFDPFSIKEPICQKAQEENTEFAEVSLDPSSSNIKNVFVSPEVVSAYLEGTSEKENIRVCGFSGSYETKDQEKCAEICDNKKSINITLDSSSVKEPISEKAIERSIQVSSDPLSSKISTVISQEGSFVALERAPKKEISPGDQRELVDVSLDPSTSKIAKPPEVCSSTSEESEKTVEESEKTTNNSGIRSAFVSKKNLDMRMSVGLSVICKDNERITESHTGKNICHSTPLVEYQKNKITRKKHSSPKEVKPSSKEVFACPDVPSHNLRERRINNKSLNISKRSRKDSGNSSDNLENSAKKNKTSPSGNGTDDFIEDISIIPNPKPLTRSRVMYHSTPISKSFRKNKSRIRVSSNINIDDKNLQQEDKMIQVSKSIFGSSTEVTNATVSKKKSIEFSNNNSSTSDDGKSNNRTKRKSYSQQSGIKKLPKLESISESRSYHSNFISTFEDDTSYCTTRKSIKKVAFKSISSEEGSNFGYENSTGDDAYTNRKSVGFRDAISLIDDTIGYSSDGDIREAVDSNFSIVDPNSIGINDTPVSVNESKTRIDRTDLSINYSAEVPEIVLTEKETEWNEMSEECTLFNKLIEMAELKKSGRNKPARQNKHSKCKKRLGGTKSAISHANSDIQRNEKWVSPNLIKFLNNKLMSDDLDHVINTDRIVSVLSSVVSAVRNLQDVEDIDFALLPLKIILLKFGICNNMIEYCTFISRFTPFEFQRKALPLEGYFGSCKRDIKKKLTDPILTETEKMSLF